MFFGSTPKDNTNDLQLSWSVRATAILEKATRSGAILPVLQVFPMAPTEVEEFSLENMGTPKGLEDLMASVKDGLAHHPHRVREDFFFYRLCSFEMSPLQNL